MSAISPTFRVPPLRVKVPFLSKDACVLKNSLEGHHTQTFSVTISNICSLFFSSLHRAFNPENWNRSMNDYCYEANKAGLIMTRQR
ncbi:hypothetical protein M5K25_012783 [Dendrobium thyrsiflorum]|uniref:Uncharacterized protein n=1 Tax=Dendrobium thyrsiflorum TaxID=117978 RepID=A0ABD0UY08_DENTH